MPLSRGEYVFVMLEVGDLGGGRHVRLVAVGAGLVRALLDSHLGFPLHATFFDWFLLDERPPYWLVCSECDIARNVFLGDSGAREGLNLFQVDHPELNMASMVAGSDQLVAGCGDVHHLAPTEADGVVRSHWLPPAYFQRVLSSCEEAITFWMEVDAAHSPPLPFAPRYHCK